MGKNTQSTYKENGEGSRETEVQFYNEDGKHMQTVTHTLQPVRDDVAEAEGMARQAIKDFSSAAFNPAGHTVVS
eukprot:1365561-Amorphochlora_amoeboformis.AAC.1